MGDKHNQYVQDSVAKIKTFTACVFSCGAFEHRFDMSSSISVSDVASICDNDDDDAIKTVIL